MTHAKLKEEDFLSTTQTLYINSENAKSDHYKLLELDNHLLEAIKTNSTVVFKGTDEDSVVLCTDTRTYDVRECETSNSLFLVPQLKYSKDLKPITTSNIEQKHVLGINYKYLEVVQSKPQLDKVIKKLEATRYKGPEQEFEYSNTTFLSFDELSNISQASQAELELFLNKMDIITIENKVRILDLDYHFRVLSFLLKSVDENSWPLHEVKKDESIDAWSEIVPKEILVAIFNMYTEESKKINDEVVYKYNELRVCQFFAKVLLQYAGKFNLNDFLQAWKDSVPEGMIVKEEMLGGIAIIDRSTNPSVVWAFPENKLPDTIPERFQMLFKAKQKWTVAEITPYVQSLTTDKMDANSLLAKYARASTVQGVRYYSSKHDN